ncbi:UDP-2,3-diacylglucosamine diphosphatase [Rodentibacter caecimuris]|uniref:UDP-2,3-diacylglucosamine diphosphatase n=1 Tax=Rodentibacter caecimuris TaxID=1796644 RepID=UPI002248DA5A|nr:UDP-2,3-diacylglucosamine diphosphatase [Rodentibacter heylii]MCX2961265.1 UDP-2,3-diacylglucosamine diphosphatase [Rodentibacter heylii]
MKKTYFISDLHLSGIQPKLTALFLDFMHNVAPTAEAVYILGDLFDFWIGDDEQSPLIAQVKRAIKNITEKGIACYFIHGNRDFLIGQRFAKETGMVLLPDYQLIDLYGTPTLLCHGDTLCIDDVKYQQFRQKVHQKWRQWLFLHLPLKVRLKIAEKIRATSRKDKAQKPDDIMDVNQSFTLAKMQQFNAPLLIHGHTHREAVHQYDGKKHIVLGDWRTDYASILVSEENGEIYFLK